MINVIGLGNAGCAIADLLGDHDPYTVYKIDTNLPKQKNCFSIAKRNDPEHYESKLPAKVINSLKKIDGTVVLVVAGGGKISSAALRILECVEKNPIEIVYIKPDLSSSSELVRTLDRITFNVFQQYARSGVFQRLYVASNGEIERVIGNIPLSQYYQKINSVIATTFHMLNVYKNTPANFSSFLDPDGISRISTIGVGTIEKMTDQMFFPLEHVSEKQYYFAINQKQLDEDPDLLTNIKRRTQQKDSNIKAGFGVYSTSYDQNYIYILENTKIIQGVDYDE
tara:strand:+ start:1043 stop:1888 length:846 start_codon:yes stop_codon:yes gene_type:complete